MPYEQGLSDWRVYSAEQAVGHDQNLTIAECAQLVADARGSKWWQEWFADTPQIAVVEGGDETPELGLISSFASPHGYPRATQWTISLHPQMMTARVLLHELAHCVAPRYVVEELRGPGKPRHRNVPDAMLRRKHRTHGLFFTAALTVITDNMLPGDDGQLAKALHHFEAPCAPAVELREQLAGQPAIVDDEEAFRAETARISAEVEAQYLAEHGTEPANVIPHTPWGFYLQDTRRYGRQRRATGRLLSQQRLAEAISAVTPCTRRHVSQFERARERPDDPAQLKRAMLAAIHLGLDPIWTRYQLGLTRWDCGDITLDDARQLNAGWADLVEHINGLLHQMPPRWQVDGAR